jgi:hypothetical protein
MEWMVTMITDHRKNIMQSSYVNTALHCSVLVSTDHGLMVWLYRITSSVSKENNHGYSYTDAWSAVQKQWQPQQFMALSKINNEQFIHGSILMH